MYSIVLHTLQERKLLLSGTSSVVSSQLRIFQSNVNRKALSRYRYSFLLCTTLPIYLAERHDSRAFCLIVGRSSICSVLPTFNYDMRYLQ